MITGLMSTPQLALSGMNASQTRLDAAAHNVANVQTEPFRREQVVQQTQPSGGVSTSLKRASNEGSALETDLVDQLQASSNYLANLAVFRTSDRMMGALLDMTA